MSMKWVAFIVFVWVTSSLLAAVMAEGYLGATHEAYLRDLAWPQIVSAQESIWTATWHVVTFAPRWFWAFLNILTFADARNTFLVGPWALVTWVVLAPIIAAAVWGVVAVFIGIFQKVLG